MASGTGTSVFSYRRVTHLAVWLLLLLLQGSAWAQEPHSILYRVGTDKLKNHILEVRAEFPPQSFPTEQRELALPVWTPGSYKVRDYSRFVSDFRVHNPGANVVKSRKNRWQVLGVDRADPLVVSYRIYGHELTVRTNYFTPELSLIIPAATFVAPLPLGSQKPQDFVVQFPDQSEAIHSGLESIGAQRYKAHNYDEFMDCPMVLGETSVLPFEVGGAEHRLVQAGDRRYWENDKCLADLKRLVLTIQEFWGGDVPYQRYSFLNLITDSRGGLEHRNSTVVMANRFSTRQRSKYLAWLSIISHEFFHTWNVKRLRPRNLGPFDYENEVYTRSLWIAEGITSYYDDLFLRRAGISTRNEYLASLAKQLNRLQTTPGRKKISLSEASFDTWIRLYQPTDDTHNTNISYYNKGAVVAWLLDTEIRRRTEGQRSLDDVMRTAFERFSAQGFTEIEFRALVSEVAGSDFSTFLRDTVDTTQELPLEGALEYWGLEFSPESSTAAPFLGLSLVPESGRAMVNKVVANSPAAEAGIAPGDELLAVDGLRIPPDASLDFIRHISKSEGILVLSSRLGRLQTRTLTPGITPHRDSKLRFKTKGSRAEALRTDWLGPPSQGSQH